MGECRRPTQLAPQRVRGLEQPLLPGKPRLRRWPVLVHSSPNCTGKCLPLPSAFGKSLTSGAAFSSFPACSRFQGNKIPQAMG